MLRSVGVPLHSHSVGLKGAKTATIAMLFVISELVKYMALNPLQAAVHLSTSRPLLGPIPNQPGLTGPSLKVFRVLRGFSKG